jgi:hypothetical protein
MQGLCFREKECIPFHGKPAPACKRSTSYPVNLCGSVANLLFLFALCSKLFSRKFKELKASLFPHSRAGSRNTLEFSFLFFLPNLVVPTIIT